MYGLRSVCLCRERLPLFISSTRQDHGRSAPKSFFPDSSGFEGVTKIVRSLIHTAVPDFDLLGFLTYLFSVNITGTVAEFLALLNQAAISAAFSIYALGVEVPDLLRTTCDPAEPCA